MIGTIFFVCEGQSVAKHHEVILLKGSWYWHSLLLYPVLFCKIHLCVMCLCTVFSLLLIVLISFPCPCLFSPCVFPSLRRQFVGVCFVFVPHVSSVFLPVFPTLHSVCPWVSFPLLCVSLVLSFFCLFFNISFSSKLTFGSTICLPGICNWVTVLLQSQKSCLM